MKTAFGVVQTRALRMFWLDQEEMSYAAAVSVWMRWFIWVGTFIVLVYQPTFTYSKYIPFLLMHLLLVTLNGYVHYRLISQRTVTSRHVFVLSAMDVTVITGGVAVDGGFSTFVFVAYYPALAFFATVFTSPLLNLTWTTATAFLYVAVSLAVESGLAMDGIDEKTLFSRVVAMYGVTLAVTLITRFQRRRGQAAMEREGELHRERIELSQAIHDTAAQTVYMVGLGIDRAIRQAGDQNRDLRDTLAATSDLSKSAMWELRRPIDIRHIFEGRELGRALRSHTETFATITAVPSGLTQSGAEPPLATETRARLFSIAHNALTNAFRHAGAGRVEVTLDFEADRVRLSVTDDGAGLPDDYAERGHGFEGMRADAERMGGRLIVETGGPEGGTTIACVVPYSGGERDD